MGKLSIDLAERTVSTRECPACPEQAFLVSGIVRAEGRALFAYDAWVHNCEEHDVEALVDVALGNAELGDLGLLDGPDGYCLVISCALSNGQVVLIDAPAVASEDPGYRSNLTSAEAEAHDRHEEWGEVLTYIVDTEPLIRRIDLGRA